MTERVEGGRRGAADMAAVPLEGDAIEGNAAPPPPRTPRSRTSTWPIKKERGWPYLNAR